MRIQTLLILILLFHINVVQAGLFDQIKSKVKNAVEQTEKQTENVIKKSVEKKTSNPQSDKKTFVKTATEEQKNINQKTNSPNLTYSESSAKMLKWDVAPPGSTLVKDIVIKGIRLGIPEILLDETLKKQGFERVGVQNKYLKEVVNINGQEKELTPSERSALPPDQRDALVKRYIITYMSIEPSERFISELDEPLKSMVDRAKEKLSEIKNARNEQSQSRGMRRVPSRWKRTANETATPSSSYIGPAKLKLVYKFNYIQFFANKSKYDRDMLMAQSRKIFGKPTYGVTGPAVTGSAFGTNKYQWLIYYDASSVPVEEKQRLLDAGQDRNGVYALKQSFSAPCGGFNDTLNCVNNDIVKQFADNLDLQLEAGRISYAPVMMIQFQAPTVNAMLHWEYVRAAGTLEENYNKQKSYEALPEAQADF